MTESVQEEIKGTNDAINQSVHRSSIDDTSAAVAVENQTG